jgi:hypothetical protein
MKPAEFATSKRPTGYVISSDHTVSDSWMNLVRAGAERMLPHGGMAYRLFLVEQSEKFLLLLLVLITSLFSPHHNPTLLYIGGIN